MSTRWLFPAPEVHKMLEPGLYLKKLLKTSYRMCVYIICVCIGVCVSVCVCMFCVLLLPMLGEIKWIKKWIIWPIHVVQYVLLEIEMFTISDDFPQRCICVAVLLNCSNLIIFIHHKHGSSENQKMQLKYKWIYR